MNESTLAAKRCIKYAGIRGFSEGRKGSLLSMLWFFPGLKLGAIKISEKTSKNCIIWEIKGIFERPFLLRYLRIYLQSLFFFFYEAKLGHSAGCHLWCWEPWILARCLPAGVGWIASSPGFNGNYCLI